VKVAALLVAGPPTRWHAPRLSDRDRARAGLRGPGQAGIKAGLVDELQLSWIGVVG
jgi:hypothetical protein